MGVAVGSGVGVAVGNGVAVGAGVGDGVGDETIPQMGVDVGVGSPDGAALSPAQAMDNAKRIAQDAAASNANAGERCLLMTGGV